MLVCFVVVVVLFLNKWRSEKQHKFIRSTITFTATVMKSNSLKRSYLLYSKCMYNIRRKKGKTAQNGK